MHSPLMPAALPSPPRSGTPIDFSTELRLVGGTPGYSGRLEIKVGDQWGTAYGPHIDDTAGEWLRRAPQCNGKLIVCFGLLRAQVTAHPALAPCPPPAATVACKQLGLPVPGRALTPVPGRSVGNAYFGQGTGPVWLQNVSGLQLHPAVLCSALLACTAWPVRSLPDAPFRMLPPRQVDCTGAEFKLQYCYHTPFKDIDQTLPHSQDAGGPGRSCCKAGILTPARACSACNARRRPPPRPLQASSAAPSPSSCGWSARRAPRWAPRAPLGDWKFWWMGNGAACAPTASPTPTPAWPAGGGWLGL